MGPSNICRRGAGACMGGQMPLRRPNRLSGPSVSHPIGEAVQHEVSRSEGRIGNNERIAIKSFLWILCKPDKTLRHIREVMVDFLV